MADHEDTTTPSSAQQAVIAINKISENLTTGMLTLNADNLTSGTVPPERMPALTGDVTSTVGTVATTIAANAVTNAKLAQMAQSTIKGRAAGAGTGSATDLTATEATAVLNVVVGDSGSGGTKGLVPAPSAGDAAANKFFKASGGFETIILTQTVNAQTGTTYTVLSSDAAKLVTFSNTSSIAVTLPQATGNFGAGFWFDVANVNTGLVTITPTTSTIDGITTLLIPQRWSGKIISDGTNWIVCSGFGKRLLSVQTASSSATLADTAVFTATYTQYEIVLENIRCATDGVDLRMEFYTGGAYPAANYTTFNLLGTSGGALNTGATGLAYMSLYGYTNNKMDNAAAASYNGRLYLIDPANTSYNKKISGFFSAEDNGAANSVDPGIVGGKYYGTTAAVTGLKIFMSSGNIATGTMKIYGLS